MKHIALPLLLAILLVSCNAVAPAGKLENWTLQRKGSSQTFQAKVPGTVAGALNEAGFFGEDIMDQENYKSIDKTLFDEPWEYTTRFAAQKGLRHVLRFESLNFYADIELNGKRIASADTCFGTFSVREFDITALARRQNKLKVTVYRAQSGDLNHGFVDWNPRAVDESMGILGPVTLISTPDVQVQDVYVNPVVKADLSYAHVLVDNTLVNRSDRPVEGELCGSFEGHYFALPVQLAPGETKHVKADVGVERPRIWWTREMGSPELYHMDVAFKVNDQVSHHKEVRFGIRSITGEIDQNGHRLFKLNGRPVLIKAGGWTDDLFFQDTPESLKQEVEMTLDMGLNCIRFENIWGKDDTIYDLCDSLGVLALVGWSCQWEWEDYCGLKEKKGFGCINDPRSEALAVRYFHDQVIRLRNHPAIIGWLTGSDRIPNPRLEQRYMEIYNSQDYRPYVCSAKGITSQLGGPSGMKMEGPYEYVGPDYWWVDTRFGGAYGFNTETGPGLNIPQEESLRQMLGQENLWPVNEVWNYHCTASSSHMNDTRFLEKVMKGLYGEAADFQDYMRKAHALDYDATRSMYEAFRGNVPVSTGIVMWMLNSAWPSLYWQMYDWYGIPTAGYFGTKAACKPVQLVFNYADNCVYVVNDAIAEAPVKARLRVYAADGKTLLRDENAQLVSKERQPAKVFGKINGPCFVALELNGEPTNFYCIPEKNNRYDWDSADWWGLNIKEYADMRFVSNLPKTKVHMELRTAGDGLDVTLVNEGEVLAYQNILKATDDDGKLFPGVVWSDNFVTLQPGETRTLHCSLPAGSANAHIGLSGWNVEL